MRLPLFTPISLTNTKLKITLLLPEKCQNSREHSKQERNDMKTVSEKRSENQKSEKESENT